MAPDYLEAALEGRRSQPHQLIEVLLDVEEACGYISQEVMSIVSKELGVPLMEVARVAHFYKAFSLAPRGKHTITVCMGTACHVRGSTTMLDQVAGMLNVQPGETTADGLFTVECVNCLGACALGPIVILDGEYHDHMTPAKFSKLIDSIKSAEKEEVGHAQS